MDTIDSSSAKKSIKRFLGLLRLEKSNVYFIYFYSILSGLLYLSLPLGIQAIISLMTAQQLSASLILLIALVVTGVFLNGFMYILQMRVTERIQVRVFTLMSLAYADRLPKLQEEAINDYHLPEMVNRFFDTSAIQKGISKILLEIPVATIQILFGLILLSLYSPIFIIFGFILITLLYIVIKLTAPSGMSSSFRESDFKYKVGFWIEEIARNLRTFKLRGKTDLALTKTNEYLDGYLEARNKHFRVLQVQFWAFTIFKTAVTAILLITGCWLFFENKINIGQFIATEIVIIMTLSSVEKIITSIDGIYDLLTSLEKASKILDKPIEKINTESALHIDTIDIDINKLSFRYAEETRFVLNDISLNTKQGEKIAVVGTKGSGKSTLLHLLTGTFLNYDGAITINNLPLFSYDLHKLRSKIGIYFSESEIFEGTLEENLIVGLADCDVNDIIHLAEQIGLKEFITKNRDGIYQVLSTHGKKLSESTKAKILLARAILKKPKLLLLDDFTYLLTKRDKNTIIDFLFNSNQQYSIFIKTSDEEIMKRCDRILLMHEGKIVADGNFQDITSSNEYKLISDDLYELH
ncbi:MAG TPA: ATP-binding cassette domain-containing protein [Chitinophagales bacterium]|jgi:ATP-binding cassette subfamily B protein|nr:ATP-binding cassette domain-containing protein [Chitinophagales bacterium]HPH87712.1 ATP-binding cassette domain-containing protein [Chitinophagales bacterium]